MTTRTPANARAIRSVYALLALVATAGLGLLLVVVGVFRADAESRSDLEDFYLRSLIIETEMAADADRAHDVIDHGVGADGELEAALDSLAGRVDELRVLQDEFGEARFESTLARLETQADRLQPGIAEEVFLDDLIRLESTLFQLTRLHEVAVEDSLDEQGAASDARLRTAVIGVLAVLLVTAALVWWLIRQLRAQLDEADRANAQLLEDQERLADGRRLQALGTLAGGIAHDFNNLLTVVLAHGDRSRARLDAERHPAAEDVGEMVRAGTRAAALTRQMLAFARRDEDLPRPVDVGAVVREMQPVLAGVARDNVDVELELEDGVVVMFDPVRLEQVVLNLVVNARDAMPDGGVVHVRLASRPGEAVDGETVRDAVLEVLDAGVGMTSDVVERAFEPFFTTKDPGAGTGLGLSTVHGFVTAAGGQVEIDSAPGAGTTVRVVLRQIDEPVPTDDTVEVGLPGGTESVLIVEDEEQIRTLVAGALQSAGYEVAAAANAADARALVDQGQQRFDLLLSDVVMPGLRGDQLLDELRREQPDMRAVLISGYAEQDVVDAINRGDVRFVPKPFRIGEVLDAVRSELDDVPTRR